MLVPRVHCMACPHCSCRTLTDLNQTSTRVSLITKYPAAAALPAMTTGCMMAKVTRIEAFDWLKVSVTVWNEHGYQQ